MLQTHGGLIGAQLAGQSLRVSDLRIFVELENLHWDEFPHVADAAGFALFFGLLWTSAWRARFLLPPLWPLQG